MNLGTVKKLPRVTLDTNVLVSALVFGGKPEQVYNLVLEKQIVAITSTILLAELLEILSKKFDFELLRIEQLEKVIKRHFKIVYPSNTIKVVRDEDDNRVLEAAVAGKCQFIITGDKDLLDLKVYQGIKIMTADQFLNLLEQS
jgi:uncharacterized protein